MRAQRRHLACVTLLAASTAACGEDVEYRENRGYFGLVQSESHGSRAFATFPLPETSGDCRSDTFDACQLTVCTGETEPVYAPAGSLRVTGRAELDLEADAGTYAATSDTQLVSPGETLTFEAEGDPDGVPSFRGEVVAPAPLERIVLHGFDGEEPVEHPRDEALRLEWRAPDDPLAVVAVSLYGEDANRQLSCATAASEGELEVPSEALTLWARGESPWAGEVSIDVGRLEFVGAGDFLVTLEAIAEGRHWALELP